MIGVLIYIPFQIAFQFGPKVKTNRFFFLNNYLNLLDIEGCGLQCKDPMYTDEEHESVHTLILWGAVVNIISNLFVIATFLIHDWKHSKHPAWNLFYISICFLCHWSG